MRLFVAADLPVQVREALCETSAALREALRGRYVAPDSFHVTLAFLGEVPGAQLGDAIAAVEEGCQGQGPLEMALGPLGSFGRARRATLWQGFARGVDELAGLAGDIRECLAERGLAYDTTLFVPHVTLMRAADLSAGVLPMPQVAKGAIETITLYRSDLTGERPRYEPLHVVRLEEPADDAWEGETS